jgi:hypothetical protein
MGSLEVIGSVYKIRFQAIATETATIQYAFSKDINNDRVLEYLLQSSNNFVDFTFQEKLRASALNLLFGAGSFAVEGDKLGGSITAALEGLGTVAIAYSLIVSAFEPLYDWESIIPFSIGLGAYVGGAIYGIIRAQTYHKPGSQLAVNPFDRLGIDLVSTANDNLGLKISYAWRF